MALTNETYARAIAGFQERPPRIFSHNGRTAFAKDDLDFIWRCEGLDVPDCEAPVYAPRSNRAATTETRKKAVDDVLFAEPVAIGKLRDAARDRGIKFPRGANKSAMISMLNASISNNGTAPDGAAFAALDALDDDSLKARALASSVDADSLDRSALISAIIAAEA